MRTLDGPAPEPGGSSRGWGQSTVGGGSVSAEPSIVPGSRARLNESIVRSAADRVSVAGLSWTDSRAQPCRVEPYFRTHTSAPICAVRQARRRR